jgi:magnesium and cobalt transporter
MMERSDDYAAGALSWWERISDVISGKPRNREELLSWLREARERDLLELDVLQMIEGAIQVTDMQVRDIMVPRSQMTVVEYDSPLKEFLPVVVESAHSRFPVIGDSRDEVLGILLAKDLLAYSVDPDKRFEIRDVLRPVVFIPESKRLNVLLREFRLKRNHMAVVVDEYGGVAGLVTIEDVLEQIVGDIEDETDIEEDQSIRQQAEGVFTVKALTPIQEFNDYFDAGLDVGEFDTIGGLVVNGFGHLPRRGEGLSIDDFRFTVLRSDGRRVHLLEVSRSAQPGEGE